MPDVNVGVLLSTTLKNYRSTLIDQIHNSHAVFFMLKQKGAIKEEDGGERISKMVLVKLNLINGERLMRKAMATLNKQVKDLAVATTNWFRPSNRYAIV
jgi:hypothetical protein